MIGVTALMRITNQAVDAGERLVKALSLDPIISGFQEYETQINAVQTILANTSSKGTTLDQVNAALDELNHYADLTMQLNCAGRSCNKQCTCSAHRGRL